MSIVNLTVSAATWATSRVPSVSSVLTMTSARHKSPPMGCSLSIENFSMCESLPVEGRSVPDGAGRVEGNRQLAGGSA